MGVLYLFYILTRLPHYYDIRYFTTKNVPGFKYWCHLAEDGVKRAEARTRKYCIITYILYVQNFDFIK